MSDQTNAPIAAEPSAAPTAPEAQEPAAAEAAPETPAEAGTQAQDAAAAPGDAPATEAKPPEEKLDRNWRAIAKQAKELRAEKERLRAEQRELAELRELRALAAQNPLAYLERSGLSYEALTDAVLRQGEAPPEEDRVTKLERRLQEREQIEAQRVAQFQEQARERVINHFETNVVEQIKAAGEKYELLNTVEGAHEEVVSAIREYAMANGALPDLAAVFDATEQVLEERAIRAAQTKRIQARLAPKSQPSPSAERAAGTTTLTNRAVSSAPGSTGADDLPLDPEERTRAIVARLFAEG